MASWRIFPAPGNLPSGTRLLVKHEMNATGYTIHLTDLSHIWVEHLDNHAIRKRAETEEVSINPSEGQDQMQILLRKLQSALEGGDDTTLSIFSKDQGQQLALQITATLPGNLKPLIWTSYLTRAIHEELASALVLPVLANLSQAKFDVESLLKQIAEKDAVIGKLRDKIEETVGFGTVYPILHRMGRRTVTRASAEKAIPGLKQFDKQGWQARSEESFGESQIGLFQHLFAPGLRCISPNQPVTQSWWTKLESTDGMSNTSRDYSQYSHAASVVTKDKNQSQACSHTPTNLRDSRDFCSGESKDYQGTRSDLQPNNDDESTTEESNADDLRDLPPVSPPSQSVSEAQTETTPRKIGRFSGKKTARVASPVESSSGPQVSNGGLYTTDEQGVDNTHPAVVSTRRIGLVGGQRQPLNPLGSREVEERSLPDNSHVPVTNDASSPQKNDNSIPQEEATLPIPTQERETEQERADRNRAQLKRALDEKRKAPMKKKKRF